MKSICTICARGGSKGVVGKNARELLGRPLLAWTIDQAKQTGLFEVIAFSSDSDPLLEAESLDDGGRPRNRGKVDLPAYPASK